MEIDIARLKIIAEKVQNNTASVDEKIELFSFLNKQLKELGEALTKTNLNK